MSNLKDPHYSSLAVKAQGGDKIAYKELLSAIYPWVEKRVSKKVFQHDDVVDVVQEVILSIHNSLNTYDSSYELLPWLSAICSRRIIDYIRKVSRKQEHEKSDDNDVTNHVGPTNIESIREQYELLEGLPENLLRPIMLTKIMGYSTGEAAKMLDVKENALRTRLSRAFKQIEHKLKEEL